MSELHPDKQKFLDDVRAGKKIYQLFGIYGPETPASDAYQDEVIKEGGRRYKLYGCTYLYKGVLDAEVVHGISLAKSLMSDIAFKFVRLVPLELAFKFVFARYSFLNFLYLLSRQIDERVMQWYDIPESEYNPFTREIKRSAKVAIDSVRWTLWTPILKKYIAFLCLVLETDSAYRFRFQDAIYEAKKRGNLTVDGIIDVLLERETPLGIARKWKLLRPGIKTAMIFSPTLRKVVKRILAELDVEKIKLDEDDWYFTLRYKSYNFRGMNENERLAEQKRIDEEKNHCFLV